MKKTSEVKVSHSGKKILTRKTMIIISIVALAIASALAIFIFLRLKFSQPMCSNDFKKCLSEASSPEEAIDSFQKLINAAKDPKEKSALYYERSVSLFEEYSQNPEYKDKIIDDLLNADELDPTSETAYRLYDFYSFYGDSGNARIYMDYCLNGRGNT